MCFNFNSLIKFVIIFIVYNGRKAKLQVFKNICRNMPNTISLILYKTRMTTFIKTKFKKSDDQTNIDKYRVAAYITEYQII